MVGTGRVRLGISIWPHVGGDLDPHPGAIVHLDVPQAPLTFDGLDEALRKVALVHLPSGEAVGVNGTVTLGTDMRVGTIDATDRARTLRVTGTWSCGLTTEALTFTGSLTGTLTAARVSQCAPSWPTPQLWLRMSGVLDGGAVQVTVAIEDAFPGRIPIGPAIDVPDTPGVDIGLSDPGPIFMVHAGAGPTHLMHGTLTLDPGFRAGSVDVSDLDGTLDVTGTWAC